MCAGRSLARPFSCFHLPRTPPPRRFADNCVPKEGLFAKQRRARSVEVRWGSAGFQPVRLGILPRRSEDLGRMPKSASKMLALPNQKRLPAARTQGPVADIVRSFARVLSVMTPHAELPCWQNGRCHAKKEERSFCKPASGELEAEPGTGLLECVHQEMLPEPHFTYTPVRPIPPGLPDHGCDSIPGLDTEASLM